jgi:hypothetical protein
MREKKTCRQTYQTHLKIKLRRRHACTAIEFNRITNWSIGVDYLQTATPAAPTWAHSINLAVS